MSPTSSSWDSTHTCHHAQLSAMNAHWFITFQCWKRNYSLLKNTHGVYAGVSFSRNVTNSSRKNGVSWSWTILWTDRNQWRRHKCFDRGTQDFQNNYFHLIALSISVISFFVTFFCARRYIWTISELNKNLFKAYWDNVLFL